MKRIFFTLFLSLIMVISFTQCEKDVPLPPDVPTPPINNLKVPLLDKSYVTLINNSFVLAGGTIISNGGTKITGNGVCWSTSAAPIKDGPNVVTSADTTSFNVELGKLEPNTKYYLRAYATNKIGTAYGEELVFTTKPQVSTLKKSIVLIIDPRLIIGIKDNLKIYVNDLEVEDYNCIIKMSNYTTPEEIRTYLQDEYKKYSPAINGAILIGKIPLARHYYKFIYTNPNIQPTINNGLTTQFYSDLDGMFSKENPLFPASYSSHTGNVKSEIWVSLLPFYENVDVTVSKINSFLIKNHNFRTGKMGVQNGFLQIDEHYNATTVAEYNNVMGFMNAGTTSWEPFTSWGNLGIYINNSIGIDDVNYGYNVALQSDKYLFATLDAHGYEKANGNLTIEKALTLNIKPVFVWLGGCNVGNLDFESNVTTEIVYSNKSNTLVAHGCSSFAGGLGNTEDGFFGHNIATAMLAGKSLGDAYLYHNNGTLIFPFSDSFDFHHAYNVFIGDLSLTIR